MSGQYCKYTTDEKDPIFNGIEDNREPSPRVHFRKISIYTLLSVLSTIFILLSLLSFARFQNIAYEHYLKFFLPKPDNATETLELQLPIFYENLVFEQEVLEHSFGNSWGIPAKVKFDTPDVDFNKVVLQLNTTVDGVQYDRMAHVFINEIPVWRTSTAEPGNKLVFSSSVKDVSKYLQLFKNPQVELIFQLDNLVSRKLTGVFHTSISVKYFSEKESEFEKGEISSFITITGKPAAKITKLIDSKGKKTPLAYYDGEPLSLSIPKISHNTTNLKLSLFASGNAAEEFWYSNVLDQNKDKFKKNGHYLQGHGPVRVVDVYLNQVKVSSVAPDPVIFTGGISPALWRPIVGVNAFDIKPIEVDLSAFLPVLWLRPAKVQVIISNGDQEDPLKISSNWILAANLLQWENPDIADSYGQIKTFDNSSTYKPETIIEDEAGFSQLVSANYETRVASNLTYVLFNGTELSLTVKTHSHSQFSNAQEYGNYGDEQLLSSVVSSRFWKEIYGANGQKLGSVKSEKAYPLSISLSSGGFVAGNVTYDANVTNVYASTLTLDDKEVFLLESFYNGTSTFTLSPEGNYGFGSAYQDFTAELHHPFPEFRVDEAVKAVNGTIVSHNHSRDFREKTTGALCLTSKNSAIYQHLIDLKGSGAISPETLRGLLLCSTSDVEDSKSIKSSDQRPALMPFKKVDLPSKHLYLGNF